MIRPVVHSVVRPVVSGVVNPNSGVAPWKQLLPQKLIVTPYTLIEDFESLTGWTINVTKELNTTEYLTGSASIKMTSPAAGTLMQMKKVVNWNLSSDGALSLECWIYCHTDVSKITQFQIVMGDDAAFTNSCQIWFPTARLKINQWNRCVIGSAGIQASTGTYNLANLKMMKINVFKTEGEVVSVSFDSINWGRVVKPAVVITWDGQYSSVMTNAYPLMKAKNMVSTMYVESSEVGGVDRMVAADLLTLNANHWDIGNHSATHPNFKDKTQAEIETELETCGSYLDGLGLTRASKHVAYPVGDVFDDDMNNAMIHWGAKTGRLSGGLIFDNAYEDAFPYKLQSFGCLNGVSLATVKTLMDGAIARQVTPHLFVHWLEAAAPPTNAWLISQFSDLVDYIELMGYQTLTIDEYYRLYSGAITVHHK